MTKLVELLDALHEPMETSSAEEIKHACELIIAVQAMTGGEYDTLVGAYERGPLRDGDVTSKSARDSLMKNGYIEKVVMKGEDGFNACTHKGAWAYRLIKAGARA